MSAQIQRLAEGGRIDRDELLGFTCNDVRYTGYAGDSLG